MELRQLKYFQLVSKAGSISKAAEQAYVAQPAVSIAIQKLEQELGVSLFDRSQKQFALTPEGKIFLQRINDILTRLDDSITELNDYKMLKRGSIKVGITPIVGAFLFPPLYAKFQKAYPYFAPVFIERGSLAIRNQLEKAELDVGILITSNISDRLASVPITTCQIMVCFSERYEFCQDESVDFSKLCNYPFILFREDTYSRKMILDECSKYGFKPNIVFSSSQIETVLGLVEQGLGITFLPDAVVYKHPSIKYRPLTKPLVIETGIAWNKDKYISSAAKTFIEFVSKFKPSAIS